MEQSKRLSDAHVAWMATAKEHDVKMAALEIQERRAAESIRSGSGNSFAPSASTRSVIGKIQHDHEAFMLALASAHAGHLVTRLNWCERDQWSRVARVAVEYLARDAAASAVAGASSTAQAAVMKVIDRICDMLTPLQLERMATIVAAMRSGPTE